MSKELTEQWRNGTLEQRYYYVKYFGNGQKPFVEIELKNFLLDLAKVKDNDRIEVLAPVPSYTDLCELKQELEICKEEKADLYAKLCNALTQLEEANEVIKTTSKVSGNIDLSQLVYEDRRKVDGITMQTESYLERYGVK